jgi:hypothetical protein
MIVMGPARDGTRLGLIDVGVPRCICWRLVRTRASFFIGDGRRRDGMGNPAGLKTGATEPFAGVFAGIEHGG